MNKHYSEDCLTIADINEMISNAQSIIDYMLSRKNDNFYSVAILSLQAKVKFFKSIIPSCMNCANRNGGSVQAVDRINENSSGYYNAPEFMASCRINGMYPANFNLGSYCCDKWRYDDIPF